MALPRLAVYVSRHGYGHLVRVGAVLDRLLDRVPLRLSVIGPQAPDLWPSRLRAVSDWIPVSCDVGVVQSDDVTVDLPATAAALQRWLASAGGIVETETRRLRGHFDLVLGDVPPPAFEAAAAAGIASVALANFSWDWIYRELGLEGAASVCAAMYAKAGLLLEAAPSAPMPAFAERVGLGLIARRPGAQRETTRARLGAGIDERLVLVALRADSASLLGLPPPRAGLRYLLPQGWPVPGSRRDVVETVGEEFLDLLRSADVVIGKPGYGLIGDVAAAPTRLLYVARPGFPEDAVLQRWLAGRAACAPVTRKALSDGTWIDAALALLESATPATLGADAADDAADVLAGCLAATAAAVDWDPRRR